MSLIVEKNNWLLQGEQEKPNSPNSLFWKKMLIGRIPIYEEGFSHQLPMLHSGLAGRLGSSLDSNVI